MLFLDLAVSVVFALSLCARHPILGGILYQLVQILHNKLCGIQNWAS